MLCWFSARMFTAKYLPSIRWSCSDARLSMQARTSGGSRDTDENALTVIPAGRLSFPIVVTTVTPLTNRLIAARNSLLLTGIHTTPGQSSTGDRPGQLTADYDKGYGVLYLSIICCSPSVDPP